MAFILLVLGLCDDDLNLLIFISLGLGIGECIFGKILHAAAVREEIIADRVCKIDDGLIFSDLLIDVVIFPDGTVRVVDLDEAADALEQGLITSDMLAAALRSTNNLLTYIHHGRFSELTACMADYIK